MTIIDRKLSRRTRPKGKAWNEVAHGPESVKMVRKAKASGKLGRDLMSWGRKPAQRKAAAPSRGKVRRPVLRRIVKRGSGLLRGGRR